MDYNTVGPENAAYRKDILEVGNKLVTFANWDNFNENAPGSNFCPFIALQNIDSSEYICSNPQVYLTQEEAEADPLSVIWWIQHIMDNQYLLINMRNKKFLYKKAGSLTSDGSDSGTIWNIGYQSDKNGKKGGFWIQNKDNCEYYSNKATHLKESIGLYSKALWRVKPASLMATLTDLHI